MSTLFHIINNLPMADLHVRYCSGKPVVFGVLHDDGVSASFQAVERVDAPTPSPLEEHSGVRPMFSPRKTTVAQA